MEPTSKISYITGDSNVFVILYQGFIQDFISEESVSKNRGGGHTRVYPWFTYLLTHLKAAVYAYTVTTAPQISPLHLFQLSRQNSLLAVSVKWVRLFTL